MPHFRPFHINNGYNPHSNPEAKGPNSDVGSELEKRGFNPQPEPPAKDPIGEETDLQKRGFNPQPEPPPMENDIFEFVGGETPIDDMDSGAGSSGGPSEGYSMQMDVQSPLDDQGFDTSSWDDGFLI